jgi:spore germination protein
MVNRRNRRVGPVGARRLCALLAAVGVGLAGCGSARPMPGTGTVPSAPVLRVLAFYPSVAKPTTAVESLLVANRAAIAELAPLWYQVMPDGSVRNQSSSALRTWAQKEHIALMPLVVNHGGTSRFLLHAAARARAVAALAAIVKQNGYDGLNIDFEQLRNSARQPLVQFMAQLHTRLRAMNKLLTIDIIPAGSRRAAQSGAYNDAGLARNADEVVLMTYDDHDNTSAPGPIAPLAWVQQRVQVALAAGIPRDRLVLGIADYGYDWPVHPRGKGVEIGLKQVDALLASQKITTKRAADGEPYFTYTLHGRKHVVWYEDSRAVLPKVAFARRQRLAGLGLWMVGFETAHYWHTVRAAAGTAATAAGFVPATPQPVPAMARAHRGSGAPQVSAEGPTADVQAHPAAVA